MSTSSSSSDAGAGAGGPRGFTPAVLVVADPPHVSELEAALQEPFPYGAVDVLVSSGGDDTIDLFESRSPRVVVLTASLEVGDAKSLIEALREMVPRERVVIVLVGDDASGVVRTALDAIDMKPDRFVSRPLSVKALRFAVQSGLENVARALGEPLTAAGAASAGNGTSNGSGSHAVPGKVIDTPSGARAVPGKVIDTPSGSHMVRHADSPIGTLESPVGSSPVIFIGPRPTFPDSSVAFAGASSDVIGDEAPGVDIRAEDIDDRGDSEPGVIRAEDGATIRPEDRIGVDDDGANGGADQPAAEATRTRTRDRVSTAASGAAAADPIAPSISRTPTPVRGSGARERAAGDTTSPLTPALPRAPTDRGLGTELRVPAAVDTAESVPTTNHVAASDAGSESTPAVPRARTTSSTSGPLRARWEALADSIAEDDLDIDVDDDVDLDEASNLVDDGAPPLPPIEINVRKKPGTNPDFMPVPPMPPWRPGSTSAVRDDELAPSPALVARPSDAEADVPSRPSSANDHIAPSREPTLIIDDSPSSPSLSPSGSGSMTIAQMSSGGLTVPQVSSAGIVPPGQAGSAAGPVAPLTGGTATTSAHEPLVTPMPSLAPGGSGAQQVPPTSPHGSPIPALAERASRERWSHPVLLSELIDKSRDSSRELLAHVREDLARLDEIDDDIVVGHPRSTPPPHAIRSGQLDALEDLMEPVAPPDLEALETSAPRPSAPVVPTPGGRSSSSRIGGGMFGGGGGTSPGFSSGAGGTDTPPTERLGAGRDFARQLRAKMSQMAQRLFQSESPAQPQVNVDIRPRHDHHTEIDLSAIGEEPAFGGGVTEIEGRQKIIDEPRSLTTSPGSWDTAVRERGMPDAGEVLRGVSDAPMILARMFAQSFTGRVHFRRENVEKIVYFDQGRPVFASSNEHNDRMGELLVREGKITASQYERCQIHVEQSGRRMGEILVDFGYLKRRELLPAVRRHVEDVLYSLFGWDDGVYQVMPEPTASAERIRLSRHPASLVLEGIRRKLGRTTLEKVLGPPSTVLEVPDRERLGGIVNAGDLSAEERAALAAFDGNADLAHVAQVTGVDVADVLPLAWGLCVLGLASARRTEPVFSDDSTALVGETDLAIDRERVRARWQLVTEADYFALLGVRRDATGFEIRRAYQAARRDFAVDAFPTDLRRELARELEDIACVLDEAFRVLRDDRLRQTYLSNLVE